MLSSAVTLFRERGVDATGLMDVVEHAGAPRGSIYHHFRGGKTQLAEEATRRAGALMGSMISASLAESGPDRTLALIIAVFRQQLVDSGFVSGCPIAAGALEGGEFPEAKQAAAEAFTTWEQTIAASLWQHGVPMPRAESIAAAGIAAIEGALIMAKAQRSTHPLDSVEAELSILLNAVIGPAQNVPAERTKQSKPTVEGRSL